MASIFKRGQRYVAQVMVGGARRSASLGRIDKASAKLAASMIEQLQQVNAGNGTPPPHVAQWLKGSPDELHAAIAKLGLAEPRTEPTRWLPRTAVKLFVDYLKRRADLSAYSRRNIEQAQAAFVKFFGETKVAAAIGDLDIEDWERSMRSYLSPATISGHIKKAKQVFRDAHRRKLLPTNPLAETKAGKQSNSARSHFVDRDRIQQVMAKISDPHMRLLVALSRVGGLRIPSEAAAMTWGDIRPESRRIIVRSQKGRRHGKATRDVPLFDELVPLIEACRELREGVSDDEQVLPVAKINRNFRTKLAKAIDRAGVEAWPRIFHNMRASRQTELSSVLPPHVVCEIMGNTRAVAEAHYLTVTPDHWNIALGKPAAQTTAAHSYLFAPLAQESPMNQAKNEETRVQRLPHAGVTYPQGESKKKALPDGKSRNRRPAAARTTARRKHDPGKEVHILRRMERICRVMGPVTLIESEVRR